MGGGERAEHLDLDNAATGIKHDVQVRIGSARVSRGRP
jgi:hypothetical protein